MLRIPRVIVCCVLLPVLHIPAEETARLSVVVHDDAGRVLPFRGYLQGPAGETLWPDGAVRVELRKAYNELHFLAQGEVSCTIPAGSTQIRAERGPEWLPAARRVDVLPGETITINLPMHRWIDMNALGWYSGDMHVHRTPDEVVASMSPENLNFAANTALWNDSNAYTKLGLPLPPLAYEVLSSSQVVNLRSQETERLGKGWGAALFLGDFAPLPLPSAPFFPLTASVCAEARARGAHIDFEKPVWRDLPVSAALGLVDSIGVVHNHFHPNDFLPMELVKDAIVPPPRIDMGPRECALYTLDLYYKLLDCGLRIPVSAGSASGVMPSWIGYERTYVKMKGPFSGDAWLRALRAGNSFATNGPVLFLTVEGQEPGVAIPLKGAKALMRLRAKALSREKTLESLEILHNGVVVASATASPAASELVIEENIEAGPGWIAARCFEPESETQIYAATSPVYLEHEGSRGVQSESAKFYADFVGSLLAQAEQENRFPDASERDAAFALLNKAQEFYRNLQLGGANR